MLLHVEIFHSQSFLVLQKLNNQETVSTFSIEGHNGRTPINPHRTLSLSRWATSRTEPGR